MTCDPPDYPPGAISDDTYEKLTDEEKCSLWDDWKERERRNLGNDRPNSPGMLTRLWWLIRSTIERFK